MFRLKNFVIAAWCLVVFAPASGRSADLSPYLDSETIAVVRVNLKEFKVALPGIYKYLENASKKAIDEVLPPNDPLKPQLVGLVIQSQIPMTMFTGKFFQEVVTGCNVEEVYAIVYRDALMAQAFPVLLAVPIPEGASQKQIDTIRAQYLNLEIPVTFVRHGFVVGIPVMDELFASQQQTMAFARKKFMEPSSQTRPEIVAALDAQPGALVQFVVGRIDQFQKDVETQINVFKPMLMMMPKEQRDEVDQALKMVPVIFQSLNSLSFSYDYAKPEIRQVIQLKDEQTAKMFLEMNLEQMKKSEEMLTQFPVIENPLEINAQNPGITPEALAATKDLFKAIQMKQEGNDVVTLIDSAGMVKLEALVYESVKSFIAGMYTGFKIGEDIRMNQFR